jgi:elongation factor G
MGELHLDIITDRLEREFKVGVNKGNPQVAYRESIKGHASAEHTFQREVAGKGQFGQATISVEPIENSLEIKVDFKKKEKSIPEEIYEAIKRGVQDAAPGGAMAGHALIGVKVTVDSVEYREAEANDVAYIIAASMAFKEACQKAGLVLMEPIMALEVTTPSDFSGDVIADVNAKRGRILGIDPKHNKDVLKAEVPLSEMFGYSTQLRSKTQGRASFTLTFKQYEPLTHNQAKEILQKRGIYI